MDLAWKEPVTNTTLQQLFTAVSRAGGYTRELELSLFQMCAMADSWKSHIEDVFGEFILAW